MLPPHPHSRRHVTAFTMIELMAVLGIISMVSAMILPTITTARKESLSIKCSANLRELTLGLLTYANDYGGRFPPNTTLPPPAISWDDADHLGRYLALPTDPSSNTPFACPADDGAIISYSMNNWASSKVDLSTIAGAMVGGGAAPQLLSAMTHRSSQSVLLTDSWSSQGSQAAGWTAPAVVGARGISEGQRFGGGAGVPLYRAGRWGVVNCELPFCQHRYGQSTGAYTQPRGGINIAFIDGHVEYCQQQNLVNDSTGLSVGRAYFYFEDKP